MNFVDFPLIKPNTLEKRLYQETILATTSQFNTMVVLPTGLGKTAVAILLVAERLNKKEGKVLVMAPTRPLVEQHMKSFAKFLEIEEGDMVVYTGKVGPIEREKGYKSKTIVFATPQVIQNDIIRGNIDLSKFSLVVFDECHRAMGDYPYPYISKTYVNSNPEGRILGLTASPGGTKDKIDSIAKNLNLEAVEIKTEEDEDVKPYVQSVDVEWIMVDLPKEFAQIQVLLSESLNERYKKLKNWGYLNTPYIKKSDLLALQARFRVILSKNSKPEPYIFQAMSITAECMKIEHALMLAETQGISSLIEYFKRMKESAEKGETKAVKRVMNDGRIEAAFLKAYELSGKGIDHPKVNELKSILKRQFESYPESKTIVFAHYRDSVNKLIDILEDVDNCRPIAFVGQAGKGGIDQKKQMEIIRQFRELKYNALVATSVAEEGLDIPAVDSVIFYEPVPSEIRSIQRRGRTGRQKTGEVVILITKDTRDEGIYWSSQQKEKKMKMLMKNMSGKKYERGTSLDEFG